MTRLEWLKNKHKELDNEIDELEAQREHDRSTEFWALLKDLKKQRLAIKTEMLEYEAQVNI